MRGFFCSLDIYFPKEAIQAKKINYSVELTQYIKQIFPATTMNSNVCYFKIDEKVQSAINFELKKFGMEKDPLRALTLTLEVYRSQFLYDFRFGEEGNLEIVGDLASSFDYHTQYNSITSS